MGPQSLRNRTDLPPGSRWSPSLWSCSPPRDERYLDVSSDVMSQIFTVSSKLPLTPPALRHLWSRLRSLPAGLRYGSAHQT